LFLILAGTRSAGRKIATRKVAKCLLSAERQV
jgi:hypothetical protein